jgi:predicted RNase H-like HicB family nuclease
MPIERQKKKWSYQINLIPDEEGGYTVVVPLLPGGISYGGTIEEATANAREAVELHLENLAAHDEPVPWGNESVHVFTTTVHVSPLECGSLLPL